MGITAEVSTADIGAWQGGVFNTAIFGVTGTDPSLLSGDIQDASNIAFIGSVRVYEAWYEHSFDSGIQILTGLRDVNSDFYSLEHADTFINGSFGIGQEIAQDNLPTWAITSPGVRIKIPLSAETYVQTAVFDGIPGDPTNPYGTHVRFDRGDGILTLFEAGWVRTNGSGRGARAHGFRLPRDLSGHGTGGDSGRTDLPHDTAPLARATTGHPICVRLRG